MSDTESFLAAEATQAYRMAMRMLACLLPLLVALSDANRAPATGTNETFKASVEPILTERCVPCHFAGGKMYDKLPFDRPQTVVTLGERLFTRIRNEEQRAAIRKFLAEQQRH